jgi:hypothetical protein
LPRATEILLSNICHGLRKYNRPFATSCGNTIAHLPRAAVQSPLARVLPVLWRVLCRIPHYMCPVCFRSGPPVT